MSNFEILDYHLRWVLYLQNIKVVYVCCVLVGFVLHNVNVM